MDENIKLHARQLAAEFADEINADLTPADRAKLCRTLTRQVRDNLAELRGTVLANLERHDRQLADQFATELGTLAAEANAHERPVQGLGLI